jgi:hypothetical protein
VSIVQLMYSQYHNILTLYDSFTLSKQTPSKDLTMLQRNIFLQVFLVIALSAIGQASAGKVVGRDTSDNEAGKSILANKNRRLIGVKGRRQGGGKGSSKGRGKVS